MTFNSELNHKFYLITTNDMDNDESISGNDKPHRLLETNKNVILNGVAKHQVSNPSDREVTKGDNNGKYNTLPHRALRWPLGRLRDRCLDF